jgi:cysteine desulfuration protein SufE
MMTAEQRQDQLIEEYSFIPEARERFQLIVETAGGGNSVPDHDRCDANLVPGCVSRVWLSVLPRAGGTVEVMIESESPALAGIAGLFRRVYSGATPEEILSTEPRFIEALAIDRFLTPTRLRGLRRLREVLVEKARNLSGRASP